MNIQAPPNLQAGGLNELVGAGINDWGGVSPVTPDHVNPEAPWPHLADLAKQTRAAGKQLVERLAIYPAYAHNTATWIAKDLRHDVHKLIDARGLARRDEWMAGTSQTVPSTLVAGRKRVVLHLLPERATDGVTYRSTARSPARVSAST